LNKHLEVSNGGARSNKHQQTNNQKVIIHQKVIMGETVSCISEEEEVDDSGVLRFNDLESDDDVLFSFSFPSCVGDENDDDLQESIDRDDFMTLTQDDVTTPVSQTDIDSRLSTLGIQLRSFYQVPDDLDKPVGVRRFPHMRSPRTGQVIYPGEVIETEQEVILEGVKYLRVFGRSPAWVFVRQPKTNKVMLLPLAGELIETRKTFMYKADQPSPIGILSGPSENCQKTSHIIFPGEEVIITAIWNPKRESNKSYMKLDDCRGWVELKHPISQIEMFIEITET
jgi:hypothetical protein